MKAVIYCRVSTQEQVNEGNSLLTQERLCKQFAKNNDYEVDKVFVEEGESAKTIYRTSLQKMMKYCTLMEGKIDAVLIYRIDRLSRETADYIALRVFFNKLGIKLVSTSEPIENTPTGRFLENVLASSAQMDNEIRGERSKNGMIDRLKQGRWMFQAPLGMKTVGEKGASNIEPVEPTASHINKVFVTLSSGLTTVEEVRRDSVRWGLVTNKGKALSTSMFHKMIRNPIYKGYLDVPSMGIYQKGSFKAIVDEKVFDQVQYILDGKRKKMPIYRKLNPDFPLRGVLKCSKCGKLLTASWAKENIGHYRCSECSNVNLNKKVLENTFSDYLKTIVWNQITVEVVKEALLLNWQSHKKEYEKELSNIAKKQVEIRELMDKVIDKNIKGVYSDALAKTKLNDYERELAELRLETQKYASPDVMEADLLNYSVDFMRNLTSMWNKLDIEPKHRLHKMLFPDGIIYLNGIFTTPVKSCLIELNDLVCVGNSTMVTLRRIELRLPG